MNKKQYNNVIENTLKHEQTDDSLSTARAIFDNMGVALPQGDIKTVYETISTDNYLGWKSCTMQEAQEAANNGTAAIGISEDRIVVLSANDEEQPVAQNASVMTLDENTTAYAVAGLEYYSYSYGTTTQGGCGDVQDGIYFEEPGMTVKVGWSGYVQPKGNCVSEVYWASSNTGVAYVDYYTGLIIAKGQGTSVITAMTSNFNLRATFIITVDKLKIYQTENTYSLDGNGNVAEDLQYNDIAVENLKAMDWINWSDFVLTTPTAFRSSWEYMCTTLFSTQPLQNVVLDMIDHFMSGSATNYSNDILTEKVVEHESTQSYCDAVKSCINSLMSTYNGDITKLKYLASSRLSNPLVKIMRERGINQPIYNTVSDKVNGLTICLDGLWGNQIEVKSYSKVGNTYSGVLEFTLYDHFGLDEADVSKYGYLAGFRAWYILQHNTEYNGAYKPFVTVMRFEIPFEGTIT